MLVSSSASPCAHVSDLLNTETHARARNNSTAKKTESGQKPAGSRASLLGSSLSSATKKKKKGKVDKASIGAPSSFQHVSHMGFDTEKGFTMDNIDPSWARLLQQLGSMGISQVRL